MALKVGDYVMATDALLRIACKEFYPPLGTVGQVVGVHGEGDKDHATTYYVDWKGFKNTVPTFEHCVISEDVVETISKEKYDAIEKAKPAKSLEDFFFRSYDDEEDGGQVLVPKDKIDEKDAKDIADALSSLFNCVIDNEKCEDCPCNDDGGCFNKEVAETMPCGDGSRCKYINGDKCCKDLNLDNNPGVMEYKNKCEGCTCDCPDDLCDLDFCQYEDRDDCCRDHCDDKSDNWTPFIDECECEWERDDKPYWDDIAGLIGITHGGYVGFMVPLGHSYALVGDSFYAQFDPDDIWDWADDEYSGEFDLAAIVYPEVVNDHHGKTACQNTFARTKEAYERGIANVLWAHDKTTEEPATSMTKEEIERALGYKINIVD